MSLTSYFENSMFDAIGSLFVGGLLGAVASFIIYSNIAALIGRSISQENLDKINAQLEADIMVNISKMHRFNFIDTLSFNTFLYVAYSIIFDSGTRDS